jgi:hypothetical protein
MIPLKCFLPPEGKIMISGGKNGTYDTSISGKKIVEGSVLMNIEEIVIDHMDYHDYHVQDLNFLQWEDWNEITKFAPVTEIREYVIKPMLKHNTSHNRWIEMMDTN